MEEIFPLWDLLKGEASVSFTVWWKPSLIKLYQMLFQLSCLLWVFGQQTFSTETTFQIVMGIDKSGRDMGRRWAFGTTPVWQELSRMLSLLFLRKFCRKVLLFLWLEIWWEVCLRLTQFTFKYWFIELFFKKKILLINSYKTIHVEVVFQLV